VWLAGEGGLAIGFGALIALNSVLLFALGTDARRTFEGSGSR